MTAMRQVFDDAVEFFRQGKYDEGKALLRGMVAPVVDDAIRQVTAEAQFRQQHDIARVRAAVRETDFFAASG